MYFRVMEVIREYPGVKRHRRRPRGGGNILEQKQQDLYRPSLSYACLLLQCVFKGFPAGDQLSATADTVDGVVMLNNGVCFRDPRCSLLHLISTIP